MSEKRDVTALPLASLPEFFDSVVGSEEEREYTDRVLREVKRLEGIERAARAVHRARNEVFQIAAPETMWGKLERLGEALRRG